MKNALIYVLSGALQRLSFLFVIPIFTRILSEEKFGIYSFWITVYALFQIFLGLGLDAAINRLYFDYQSNPNESSNYLGSVLRFQWILVLPVAILLGFIIYIIGSIFFKELLLFPFLPLIILSASLQKIFESVLSAYRAARRPGRFCLATFISFVSLFSFIILFLFVFKFGLVGVFCALALSNLLSSSFVTFVLFKDLSFQFFSPSYVSKSLSYGLPTIPGKFGGWVSRFSSKLLIVQILSPVALSQFQIASVPLSLITLFAVSINNAYVPWFYSKAAKFSSNKSINENQEFSALVSETKKFDACLLIVYALVTLPFLFFPEFVVGVLAPIAEYNDAVAYLPLLAFSAFLFCQYTLWNRFLTLNKQTFLSSWSVFIPGIVGVILNIVLMPAFSLIVPALVSVFSSLLTCFIVFVFAFNKSLISRSFRLEFWRLQFFNLVVVLFWLFPWASFSVSRGYGVDLSFRLLAVTLYCLLAVSLFGFSSLRVLCVSR